MDADIVLLATGRVPFTEGLGLENVGIKVGARGMVEVDDHFTTNVPGIFAIGDVVRGAMLAHKAEEEGIAIIEQERSVLTMVRLTMATLTMSIAIIEQVRSSPQQW